MGSRVMWRQGSPLDVTKLEKGHDYRPEELGAVMPTARKSSEYALRLMAVVERIKHDIEALGIQMSVRVRRGLIHVMTDAEASSYHAAGADRARRSIGRHVHALHCRVDADELTAEELERHTAARDEWSLRYKMVVTPLKRLREYLDAPRSRIVAAIEEDGEE